MSDEEQGSSGRTSWDFISDFRHMLFRTPEAFACVCIGLVLAWLATNAKTAGLQVSLAVAALACFLGAVVEWIIRAAPEFVDGLRATPPLIQLYHAPMINPAIWSHWLDVQVPGCVLAVRGVVWRADTASHEYQVYESGDLVGFFKALYQGERGDKTQVQGVARLRLQHVDTLTKKLARETFIDFYTYTQPWTLCMAIGYGMPAADRAAAFEELVLRLGGFEGLTRVEPGKPLGNEEYPNLMPDDTVVDVDRLLAGSLFTGTVDSAGTDDEGEGDDEGGGDGEPEDGQGVEL